jgi:uncharacterized protein
MAGKAPAFIIALLIFSRPTTAQALDDAADALRHCDYSTAFRILKPLAEQGDVAAQNNLGVLYRNGQGTRQDYGEALGVVVRRPSCTKDQQGWFCGVRH